MNLKDKTILFLGSSVTYGSASNGISFVDMIEELCGAICIKEAVSGTTLVDINESSYISRLKSIPTSLQPDLFVCQLSTNDAARKLDIKKIEKSVCFILSYVKNTFGCPTVFYTGTYYENNEYMKMVALLYDLKKKYDFYILDLYHNEEMLAVSETDYQRYMKDEVHPTLVGYKEWWTPKFIDFLETSVL